MYEYSARKPAGHIIIVEPGVPTIERDTLQCVHCGMHWIVKPGSGRRRGWCLRCNGPHCGGEKCWECVPELSKVYGEKTLYGVKR